MCTDTHAYRTHTYTHTQRRLPADAEGLSHAHKHALQVACKELAERNEDLSRILEGAYATIRQKEQEAEQLHVRLAEQLTMLDLAFSRRDIEIQRSEELQGILVCVFVYMYVWVLVWERLYFLVTLWTFGGLSVRELGPSYYLNMHTFPQARMGACLRDMK